MSNDRENLPVGLPIAKQGAPELAIEIAELSYLLNALSGYPQIRGERL